ncbi:hypothetical protein BCR36DRAFT_445936, partial [Piromyces finnis]
MFTDSQPYFDPYQNQNYNLFTQHSGGTNYNYFNNNDSPYTYNGYYNNNYNNNYDNNNNYNNYNMRFNGNYNMRNQLNMFNQSQRNKCFRCQQVGHKMQDCKYTFQELAEMEKQGLIN